MNPERQFGEEPKFGVTTARSRGIPGTNAGKLNGKPANFKPRQEREGRALQAAPDDPSNTSRVSEQPTFTKEEVEELYRLLNSSQLASNSSWVFYFRSDLARGWCIDAENTLFDRS